MQVQSPLNLNGLIFSICLQWLLVKLDIIRAVKEIANYQM